MPGLLSTNRDKLITLCLLVGANILITTAVLKADYHVCLRVVAWLGWSSIRVNLNVTDSPESGRARIAEMTIWSAQIVIWAIWVVLKK